MKTKQSQPGNALEDLERLAKSFRGPSGLVAEELRSLMVAERLHGEALLGDVRGFTCLLDCFQAFVIRSFGSAWKPESIRDLPQLCQFIAAFRALRASYRVFWLGYYFEAAADLRTVGESTLVLAAVAKGLVARGGVAQLQKEALRKATRTLLGKDSGLSPLERDAIKDLHETLGLHVHGAKLLSGLLTMRALERREKPQIEPYLDLTDASHYCQVSVCMAWALHRVMWTILDRPDEENWHNQYSLLDRAFRSFVGDWDKPVARAFSRWVDLQLGFAEENSRRTGTGTRTS